MADTDDAAPTEVAFSRAISEIGRDLPQMISNGVANLLHADPNTMLMQALFEGGSGAPGDPLPTTVDLDAGGATILEGRPDDAVHTVSDPAAETHEEAPPEPTPVDIHAADTAAPYTEV